jgi:hypothetical protein
MNPRGIQWNGGSEESRFDYGLGLGWNFGRDEDDDAKLNGLGDIDMVITGTVWASMTLDAKGYFKNKISFTHDLNDAYGGYTVKNELSSALYFSSIKVFGQVGINGIYGSKD